MAKRLSTDAENSSTITDDVYPKMELAYRQQLRNEGRTDIEINDIINPFAEQISAFNAAKKKKGLPSFSDYKWSDAIRDFKLDTTESSVTEPLKALENAGKLPSFRLPKSVQIELVKRGWETLDVYFEIRKQVNEAACVRTLEPVRSVFTEISHNADRLPHAQWISYLASRFYGRLNNRPESKMDGGDNASGGSCEYEVSISVVTA